MKSIFIAVATSLISSFIFWIIFNYIPEKRRYNKVRSKVEFDIYEIFSCLEGYINISLQINEYSRYFPFDPIKAGCATKDDFELWLQNKCLSSDYLFDEMKEKLIPVGEYLEKQATKICNKIEKCSTYYSFMTNEEILLLQKINAKVATYSYDEPATEKVGQTTLRVVVPTIAYMAENFYDLSNLYISLQQIVWSYKKIDRTINKYTLTDFNFDKAEKCYYNGDFTKCLKYIKKSKYVSEERKLILRFKAYYNLKMKSKAFSVLKLYFEISSYKTSILYSILYDKFIDLTTFDDSLWTLIFQNLSEIDIMETIEYKRITRTIEMQGLKTAKEIKSFYENLLKQKDENASKKMKEKREKIEEKIANLYQNIEKQSNMQ